MALSSIQGDAARLCRNLGLSNDLKLIEQAWLAEMGGMDRVAEVAAIDHRTLVIETRSSAAMQEISLRRRELVRRINRYFPDPRIQDISVRMAQVHGR